MTYFAEPHEAMAIGATIFSGRAPVSWASRHEKRAAPGLWLVTENRPALMDGKPATMTREFGAVVDDFGQLVEVPA